MDVKKIRKDFPVLNQLIDGKPIIYFDNSCMSLKPTQVIDAMNEYYYNYPACAGRSIHKLATKVTIKAEDAREKLRKLINAKNSKELIFTKNSTEAINLVAHSLDFKKNDMVLTTDKEHNSNSAPWFLMETKKGIKRKIVHSNENMTFNLEHFEEQITKKTKLVSMVHTSNLDGYTIPAEEIINHSRFCSNLSSFLL